MGTRKKILVIDDDPGTLKIISDLFQSDECDIFTATDGLDGLEKARNDRPDCIILDIRVPKLNGFKVCRFLKFDETFKHMPVIMLSANNDPSDIDLGKEVGADLLMTKPVDNAAMRAAVLARLGLDDQV